MQAQIDARFEATNTQIERLAELTAKGFAGVNTRIDELTQRVGAACSISTRGWTVWRTRCANVSAS